MDICKEMLYGLIEDIKKIISDQEKADGSVHMDMVRAAMILEFAKTELKKTIAE